MTFSNYDEGDTFVAYIDVCGFKVHMKNGIGFKTLDNFYRESYQILKDYGEKINSIFISDCGVLFVRGNFTPEEKLKILLEAIKKINEQMLSYDIMLGTSIAYGDFKYQNRIEFKGIIKNNLYGNAYLNAFLDAERKGKQKIQPGQCRIVKENFPIDLSRTEDEELFNLLENRKYYPKNYYFYWTLSNHEEIGNFEEKYKNAYRLKEKEGYHLITQVLKDYKSYSVKPTP